MNTYMHIFFVYFNYLSNIKIKSGYPQDGTFSEHKLPFRGGYFYIIFIYNQKLSLELELDEFLPKLVVLNFKRKKMFI